MSVAPLDSIVRLASPPAAVPSCGGIDPPDAVLDVRPIPARCSVAMPPLAVYLLIGARSSDHDRCRGPVGFRGGLRPRKGRDPQLVVRHREAMKGACEFRRLRGQRNPQDRPEPPAMPATRDALFCLKLLLVEAGTFMRAHAQEYLDGVVSPAKLEAVMIAAADHRRHV